MTETARVEHVEQDQRQPQPGVALAPDAPAHDQRAHGEQAGVHPLDRVGPVGVRDHREQGQHLVDDAAPDEATASPGV